MLIEMRNESRRQEYFSSRAGLAPYHVQHGHDHEKHPPKKFGEGQKSRKSKRFSFRECRNCFHLLC